MSKPLSIFAVALMLALPTSAFSQQTPQAIGQQITGIAPQLTAFAGSPANLQALSAGLVQGVPIVLSATTADGITQTVTIFPVAAMTVQNAAIALERARQLLITRGVGAPTPEQIGVALVGGTLSAPLGSSLVNGVLTGTANPAAMQVQRQVAGLQPGGASSANLQNLTTGLTQGSAVTLSGTGPSGQPQTLTFTPPGGPMSALEAGQALQLAGQILAAQGLINPTPEQIRVAFLGGTLSTGNGIVAVRGVLEGRGTPAVSTIGSTVGTSASPIIGTSASPIVSTSASPLFGTSDSPARNTSVSPLFGTSNTPGGAATGRNGPPSPAAQIQGRR
jgi:hypothetical protein